MSTLPLDVAETQHGLVTTGELSASGLNAAQIRWALIDGRLIRLSPRLFRVRGAPATDAQRVLAAVLDAGPGSALSHTSALAWWDVPGFQLDELHVTHPRDGVHRPARLADHVHDVTLLPDRHVCTLDGVPVVVPARALFDIAGQPHVHPKRVERAVDNAWAMRLVSGAALATMLDELAKRGRPGIRLMRELLEERGRDYVPPASGLEARVDQILRESGQRPLRRQVDAGDDHGWIGRVDFADDEVPFLLEVQSERFHKSLTDERNDSDRLARLDAAGFEVATVTDLDVWHRTWRVVQAVRDGRLNARARIVARAATAA